MKQPSSEDEKEFKATDYLDSPDKETMRLQRSVSSVNLNVCKNVYNK